MYIHSYQAIKLDETGEKKMKNIKVLKHGVKVNGTYYKCWYSLGGLIDKYPKETITVHASNKFGCYLPKELNPTNNSDSMSDYFENDRARIFPNHPLYNDFLKHVR